MFSVKAKESREDWALENENIFTCCKGLSFHTVGRFAHLDPCPSANLRLLGHVIFYAEPLNFFNWANCICA